MAGESGNVVELRRPICEACPFKPTAQEKRVNGIARGCAGPVTVEKVTVVLKLDASTDEILVGEPITLCGREPEKVQAAIGTLTTERRIVERITDEDDGMQYVTVAQGPADLLARHYGPTDPSTPRPESSWYSPAAGTETSGRPDLQVLEGGGSMTEVYTGLDRAVELIGEANLAGLLEEGAARIRRVTTELDGSTSGNVDAMQAAGMLLLGDLRAALSAATEFQEEVGRYKDSTGA